MRLLMGALIPRTRESSWRTAFVIPLENGIQADDEVWMPACAGMTDHDSSLPTKDYSA